MKKNIQKSIFTIILSLVSFTIASAQFSPYMSGMMLNKNGVELGYKASFTPGLNELRAGGKLENVTFGAKYLVLFNAVNKSSTSGGFGLDVGYDWRFARKFGLNSNITADWLNFPQSAPNSKTALSLMQFELNFYGHFENAQKTFFFKPIIGLGIEFQNYTTTFDTPQNTTTTKNFAQRKLALDLGLGVGVPFKRFTIGLLPVYRFWDGSFLLTTSLGYNFSLEQDFDGKDK